MFLQVKVAKFVMTIKHLIIATQLVICLNKGQNIEILWNKLIIVIYSVFFLYYPPKHRQLIKACKQTCAMTYL